MSKKSLVKKPESSHAEARDRALREAEALYIEALKNEEIRDPKVEVEEDSDGDFLAASKESHGHIIGISKVTSD